MFLSRNIPAYAGKTLVVHLLVRLKPEHPRVCGENRPLRGCWGGGEGTSPRMRGKHFLIVDPCAGDGNIPAYAGKTLQLQPDQVILEEHPRVCGKTASSSLLSSSLAEHPRVCGENCPRLLAACGITGTSPRMRGKLPAPRTLRNLHRNIPAYAGKTFHCFGAWVWWWEHPRVCGENLQFACAAKPLPGNIPAYAGKTSIVPETC